MLLKWTDKVSTRPLCGPGETCSDDYMVNAVGISDDGSRLVAGTYYQNYLGTTRTRVDGTYGLYVFDTAGTGTRLFASEYSGDRGVYDVAISGDGAVVAAGGLFTDGTATPFTPKRGIVRAFEVATQKELLNTTDFPARVNAVALSHDGGVLAVVAEFFVYVFIRKSSGLFPKKPHAVPLSGYSDAIDVHPSGRWLAAADRRGTIYILTITSGVVGPPSTCVIEEPADPALPLSNKDVVPFHRVAVARAADALVAASHHFVYLLTPASVQGPNPGPVARFATLDAAGKHSAWGVAISDAATFVTVVVNDRNPTGGPDTGRLMKLSLAGSVLSKDWEALLHHLPNSTSIDSSGTRITVCDGYPVTVPGTFYLFDDLGAKLGEHTTTKMCWPMVISADGSGIAAGDDDNNLFFFTP
jgi:hypothetical protein